MPGQPVKTILYLGLEPPSEKEGQRLHHFPVIRIVPRPAGDPNIVRFYENLLACTHLLFTSKQAVRIFFQYLSVFHGSSKSAQCAKIAAVGRSTALEVAKHGLKASFVAAEETAEGLCEALMQEMDPSHVFAWPHSALSRRVIPDFLDANGARYSDCVFYDTHFIQPSPAPSLNEIDEIVFTSPSTVEGFLRAYGELPKDKALTALGPITQKVLLHYSLE